jgi:hypothetical protein
MKPMLILFLFLTCPAALPQPSANPFEPMPLAKDLYGSLDTGQQQLYYRSFDDPRRKTWERLPVAREGLKILSLSDSQKTLLHRFLQAALSSEGYLMVTAIMFNEDIQQRFEPYLGKIEFYIELFGMPVEGGYWGWQLEGHHLSINLTFRGNQLVSHTPFLLASNPQVVNSDRERNGLCLVYMEEQIAAEVALAFNGSARQQGYSDQKPPTQVYGERNKMALEAPAQGVALSDMDQPQLNRIKSLAGAYIRYFRYSDQEMDSIRSGLTAPDTRFYYMANTHYNEEHYYRLYNQEHLVECENYGNHTHHFWRSANDFGQAVKQ